MQNFKYIKIHQGYYFGAIDIVGSILSLQDEYEEGWFLDEWYEEFERIDRQFNVWTGAKQVDLLTLSLKHVWDMKTEFNEEYLLFVNLDDKKKLLTRCHSLKRKAIDKMQSISKAVESQPDEEPIKEETEQYTCNCHGNV